MPDWIAHASRCDRQALLIQRTGSAEIVLVAARTAARI